jgi:hypothetical protein
VIGSGVVASSLTLTAFGIDRLIELVSAGVLLWRPVGGRNRFARGDQQIALTICNSICMSVLCVSLLPYPKRQNFSAFMPTLCVVGNAKAKSSRAGLLAIFAATTSLIFAPILSTLRLRLRVRPWLTRVYQAMTKKKIWSGKSKFLKAIAQRKDRLSSLLPTLALA